MTTDTKVGFDGALALAIARYICEIHLKGSDPERLQRSLEAGHGLLFIPGGLLADALAVIIFQDDDGATRVLAGRCLACFDSEINTRQGAPTYMQTNGDWIYVDGSSAIYANLRSGGKSAVYCLVETTDYLVPTFVAGFEAGRKAK